MTKSYSAENKNLLYILRILTLYNKSLMKKYSL